MSFSREITCDGAIVTHFLPFCLLTVGVGKARVKVTIYMHSKGIKLHSEGKKCPLLLADLTRYDIMQINSERGYKLWCKYLSNFKIVTAERKEKITKLEPTIWKEKYFLCFQALSQPESTQKIIAQKLCMFQQVTGHAPSSTALKLTAWNTCRQHNMSAVFFITSINPA